MADVASLLAPGGDTTPARLVDALLSFSATATWLLRPVCQTGSGSVSDFDWVQLNPAAQRLLQLPAQPTAPLRACLTQAPGVFEFCCEVYLAGLAGHPRTGQVGAYSLVAQRHGPLLLVSATAASNQAPAEPVPHGLPAHLGAGRLASLAAQQPLPQQILQQVPAAVATLSGPEHRYTFYNDQYQAISAHRAELGSTIALALPELVAQGFTDLLDQVYATGQPVAGTDKPVQLLDRATGQLLPHYFDFIYQPLTTEQGQPRGILIFIVDTTERVLARQQAEAAHRALATTNARLTRTNADLDTFVYSASHDLRAPISNIEGLLLALRQELPVEAWQAELVPRLLDMMDGAIARFQQTLGYLTDVTRLQPGAADQDAELVELPALVEAVRLDILPELAASRATLTVDLAEFPRLWASPRLLRSIFYNFLSNAIKYRAPDRPAVIELRSRRAAPGYLALEVQDNGLGLTQQEQAALFQLFKRLHTHVSGSGVGLYMVKKMVDNAGGALTVESQPGVGSTFTATLPLSSRPLLQ